MSGGNEDLPFRIELRDDAGRHIEDCPGSDFASTCGAYDEAVERKAHNAAAEGASD